MSTSHRTASTSRSRPESPAQRWHERLYRLARRGARMTLDTLQDRPAPLFKHLLRRARARGALHVIFDHRMGGGSNIFRDRLIGQRLASSATSLLLVTIGRDDRQIECQLYRRRPVRHRPASVKALMDLLGECAFDEVVINDLVTWPDPIGVMASIRELARQQQAPITVLFHDHFFLCPSWTLLNHEERYCGLPDMRECNRCLKSHGDRFVKESDITDMPAWREAARGFLEDAREIVCFSRYTASLVRKTFPSSPLNIVVRPHELLHVPSRLPRTDPHQPLCIGVLGNIGFHKGARIVEELAALIERENIDARIVIIGRYSRPVRSGIEVHGKYERDELPGLIDHYGITVFFFPSIWPETFSYVCAEIMALQMPLVAFDLGAPAERIRDYPFGRLVSQIDATAGLDEILALRSELARSADRHAPAGASTDGPGSPIR